MKYAARQKNGVKKVSRPKGEKSYQSNPISHIIRGFSSGYKIKVSDIMPNTSNGVGTPNSELEAYPLAKIIKDDRKTKNS